MIHDLRLRGHAYGLRPVTRADSPAIVALRGAAGPFLNPGATTPQAQDAWFDAYALRPDDYTFVIERLRDGAAVGLVGVYDFDRAAGAAEWGRFVVAPGVPAAVEGALLLYRCAFEALDLAVLVCRTLSANAQVVSFHDRCGLARMQGTVSVAHGNARAEAVQHELTRATWPRVRDRLEPLAQRLARMHAPAPSPC